MKALTLAGMLVLAGCGRSDAPAAVAVPVSVPTAEPPPSPVPQDRYWLAGMKNEAEARGFVVGLQTAAEQRNKAALLDAVRYPFTHRPKGKPKVYRHRAELAPHFERVFTPKVLRVLREWEQEGLFVNYQGAMVSSGTVWFDKRKDGIRIIAVND